MTYTKFGEFMRVLRVRHHEVMGDVAKLLGVSTPFLSAVENGRKNVPNEWFDIIAEHYALSDDEIADMKNAAENSRNQVKITLSKSETYQRDVALQFARSFDGIDEDTAEKILALLKRPANKSQPLKLKKQKKFSERKKDTTKRLPEQPKKFLAGRQP